MMMGNLSKILNVMIGLKISSMLFNFRGKWY